MINKAIKGLALLVAFLILVVAGYVGTSFVTARMSGADASKAETLGGGLKSESIYLVTGTLHADFVIPVSENLLEEFSFLKESKLPLSNPNLRYLAFGWGSKAFYTTAGSYSDITFGAAAKAITGDDSVMRVFALGEIDTTSSDAIKFAISKEQLAALLAFFQTSFERDETGQALHLPNATIGPNDAFYEGVGDFNIFHPCNQWVNFGLRQMGIDVGRWTPTTQSLRHSLAYFKSAEFN